MYCTSPISPASISSLAWAHIGMNRRVWSTDRTVLFRSQASSMRAPSSTVVARGFSQKMPFAPASAASTTSWAWALSPVATETMSRDCSSSMRRWLV